MDVTQPLQINSQFQEIGKAPYRENFVLHLNHSEGTHLLSFESKEQSLAMP
jgi:hypothetical protein